jgi:Flp pilus assembly protein TadG
MGRGSLHGALRLLRRLGASNDGASAVEFALVAPILLTLLFGIFEFGRVLWTQGILDYAVEQAARCASIDTTNCGSSGAIKSYASALTTPLNLNTSVFTATTAACGNQVTASYPFNFIGTFALIGGNALFPTSVTLTSSSCYPT